MSEPLQPYGQAPARDWTPDPHRVATAAIAVLDAGDEMLTLLGRVEGLLVHPASGALAGSLIQLLTRVHDRWRTASRNLLDTLNDDEEEILL